mmetsp:Transcript_5288/g.7380  ORF Transcript_5288/g.7380 Transcript_5288/m.7380 type:complete len:102 (-) Transcript_5288:54-359(-)
MKGIISSIGPPHVPPPHQSVMNSFDTSHKEGYVCQTLIECRIDASWRPKQPPQAIIKDSLTICLFVRDRKGDMPAYLLPYPQVFPEEAACLVQQEASWGSY